MENVQRLFLERIFEHFPKTSEGFYIKTQNRCIIVFLVCKIQFSDLYKEHFLICINCIFCFVYIAFSGFRMESLVPRRMSHTSVKKAEEIVPTVIIHSQRRQWQEGGEQDDTNTYTQNIRSFYRDVEGHLI